jgi:hypothetical protein
MVRASRSGRFPHFYFKGIDMKFTNRLPLIVAAVISAASRAANAAGVDLTPVTGAFTAADVVTGVMAVAAVLAVIYVSIKAAKIVLGMLKGG